MNEKSSRSAIPPAAQPRAALLAGCTGLVGGHLLRLLLAAPDYQRIYAVTRRPLNFDHPRLANRILPFEQLATQLRGVPCHDAYCCLGSTRREAGSDEALRHVDVELVLAFARAARACGAQRLVVVSSAGAAATSRHPYLRHKAEMEAALAEVGFPSLDVLRPGLLIGWRRQPRPLELAAMAVMPAVNPLLRGNLARWRAVPARQVAAAMLGAARSQRRGRYVYPSDALPQLAAAGVRGVAGIG